MNADGSGQTPLTGGAGEGGTLPAWSPDGTKIVFDSNAFTAPKGYDIFVMNTDGTRWTRIDTGPDGRPRPELAAGRRARRLPPPKRATPLRVSLVPAYTAVHGAQPHAWPTACLRILQPARARVESAHRGLARRERSAGELERLREVRRSRRRARRRRRLRRQLHVRAHRRAPPGHARRLHGRAAGDHTSSGSRTGWAGRQTSRPPSWTSCSR